MYKITNGALEAEISGFGAELKSLKCFGHEILWQSDPFIWAGSAPLLFPVVGRLKNRSYVYKDEVYKMPVHGFARRCLFYPENSLDDSLTLYTESDFETKLMYPFDFILKVSFSFLSGNEIRIDYKIKNCDQEIMYFSLGSHPGFNLSLKNCSISDYYIELQKRETLYLYKIANETLALSPHPFLQNSNIIKLSYNTFKDDIIILKDIKSRIVTLGNLKIDRKISVDMGHADTLGIWGKPGVNFVCICPLYGYDDPSDVSGKLQEKPGIISLLPDSEFNAFYTIKTVNFNKDC